MQRNTDLPLDCRVWGALKAEQTAFRFGQAGMSDLGETSRFTWLQPSQIPTATGIKTTVFFF